MKNNFKFSKTQIADYEILQLQNPSGASSFSIIPKLGANLNSFVVDGLDIILSSNGLEQIQSQTIQAYSGAQLFPYVNRIKNGEYSFNNKIFKLPINELPANNSLHGLVYNKEFDVEIDESSGTINTSYLYDNDNNGYPYKVLVKNIFQRSDNSLRIETIIQNLSDQTIPLGHGWHPYFKVSGNLDDAYLMIPSSHYFEVDKQQIPTGELKLFDKFTKLNKIGSTELDSCFEIESEDSLVAQLLYGDKKTSIKLFAEGYPYLQVYTPATRDLIAIEPQTSAPDAFNNGVGNILLRPSETITLKIKISVQKGLA